MSGAYRPAKNATADEPWKTAFLSERDVSAQVPINFVPHAGVHLTPACFSDGVYEDAATQLCLSNLIASQIRRFIIDLYWDPSTRTFGLCPVQLGPNARGLLNQPSRSMANSTMFNDIEAQQNLQARQTAPSNNATSSSAFSSGQATNSSTSVLPFSTTTSESGAVLLRIGGYQCSTSLSIDNLLAVFSGYFVQSGNTLDARLEYIIINLRAATQSDSSAASIPALSEAQLPSSDERLQTRLGDLDQYIYKPSELNEERLNLNRTWYFTSDSNSLPLNQYFTTITFPNGVLVTPDGWPSENYVQLERQRRTLIGYGIIDEAMAGYNTARDDSIFAAGQLGSDQAAEINDVGAITSGCFYNASEYDLQQVNSSWAVSSLVTTNLQTLGNGADNFTSCGISPLLNTTLTSGAADDNPDPYQSFGNQALFSWAVGQPKNDAELGNSIDSAQYRCAIISSSNENRGHWLVADCQAEYQVACREGNQPYLWRISRDRFTYRKASTACTSNATFDVPRTGLENTYLYQRILSESNQRNDRSMVNAIWINFNSLDIETCWVTSGYNGTCPYRPDEDAIRQRQILVPAIAAIIVLLLTLLTILVKCNTNRRNSKIRKRGEGGWDYEGVPS